MAAKIDQIIIDNYKIEIFRDTFADHIGEKTEMYYEIFTPNGKKIDTMWFSNQRRDRVDFKHWAEVAINRDKATPKDLEPATNICPDKIENIFLAVFKSQPEFSTKNFVITR